MKVWELIEALEGFDQDADVRLAQQPSWPFEYSIGNVICAPDPGRASQLPVDDRQTVYIGEGHQIGYLDSEIAKRCL